jgi:hypothetical protein
MTPHDAVEGQPSDSLELVEKYGLVNHAKEAPLQVRAVAKLVDQGENLLGTTLGDEVRGPTPAEERVARKQPEPSFIGRVEVSELFDQPLESEQSL